MPGLTLADVDAICVPGGFGIRGLEGKLGALTYAWSQFEGAYVGNLTVVLP